jgi:hypothetical protein
MAELEKITIAPGLTFDALVAGASGAPLVLLLHGFAESMHCWRAQVSALAGAGYRAVAPSQRGYSKGARPDTADTANYHIERAIEGVGMRPAFPLPQSRSILACSATRRRWKRRWPGIARAERSARRLARSASRRCTSGAMPTTPSGG